MAMDVLIPDQYDPEFQGRDYIHPGRYHLLVLDVDEDGGSNGEMIVDLEICAGTVPGQEGLKYRSYFIKSTKAMGRILQFAMACKLITAAQIKDMKSRNVAPRLDFEGQAKGRHVCMELSEEEYEGKKRIKDGYAIFAPDDPKVKDPVMWPKNLRSLAAAGYAIPGQTVAPQQPQTGMQQSPAPVQTPQQTTPPALNLAGMV